MEKIEGYPQKIVHCLGWCHKMTPVTVDGRTQT